VTNGRTRFTTDCVLSQNPPESVLIHDGDRPFIAREVIGAVLAGVGAGGAIAAVPARDKLKWVDRED